MYKKIGLVGAACAVLFLLANSVALASLIPVASQDLPVRLQIPSIGVDTAINGVGLTTSGHMAMIKTTKQVAWFDQGPVPGQVGSAVIGGHFGYQTPGVLYNLGKLKVGERVYVTDSQGATKQFIVEGMKVYNATDTVPEVFSSSDGVSHLNIITCHGTWIPSLQTYSQRLVVFTNLVS